MIDFDPLDSHGTVRFDLCPVCRNSRKALSSKACRGCTADARLSPRLEGLPPPGKMDYFPAKGRYGILAVSGVAGSRDRGTTLSVLDSHNNWEEIERVYAKMTNLARKRAEMVEWVKNLNRYETV